MGLRLVYESGISGQTEEIQEDRLRLYGFDVTEHAEEGSVALSSITVDDPDGDLDVVGWRRTWTYEDTASGSNSLIHHGWIADRKVSRGPYLTGAGRIWTITVADQNTVLGFRVMTSASANRPAETDVARMNWLAGVMATFGRAPVVETEFLSQSSAVLMDEADYRGQTTLDIANDCAQQSGKNFFLYTKDNGYPATQPTRGIWYGFGATSTYSSPLRLTNVLTDVDNVLTFAIGEDTELVRDPSRVFSGAYVQYQNGAIYEQVTSTYNVYTQRDAVVAAPNVKSSGAATRRAIRYLADLDTEDDRITTSFYVPADKVAFVKPGMRIQFRATHLPQYEQYVWLRVLSRSVREISEHESADPKYLVSLTLSSDDIPVSPVGAGDTVLTATLTIGSAAFVGDPSDRQQHWASDLGASLPTMVIGKQYRFLATVVDALYSTTLTCSPGVPRGYSLMNAPTLNLNNGAGSSGLIGNTFSWNPGSCTSTGQGGCASGGITFGFRTDTCGDGLYGPGVTYTGDWLTFNGPTAPTADISISGTPISGFVGFKWVVRLELQERAAP